MKILITGATGFVGRALISQLDCDGHFISAVVRSHSTLFSDKVEQVTLDDLGKLSSFSQTEVVKDGSTDSKESYIASLSKVLEQTEVLIHTAARVHVMDDTADDPLNEFRKVNRDATLSLARLAAKSGVKRFIFLSTIKVNGESTDPGKPFSEQDSCDPSDPYGISKYEAEQGLLSIAEETGMEVVIIRPPLIYGPGVKGNFASMMRWVGKGIPLPLGAVDNQRSLLALDNLIDFISCCLDHPKAANQVFLLSDGQDVSTTKLIQNLAHAQGKKVRLLPVPVSLMTYMASLLGKKAVTERLFGSLQVDISKARNLLGWSPVVTMDEALINMCNKRF